MFSQIQRKMNSSEPTALRDAHRSTTSSVALRMRAFKLGHAQPIRRRLLMTDPVLAAYQRIIEGDTKQCAALSHPILEMS